MRWRWWHEDAATQCYDDDTRKSSYGGDRQQEYTDPECWQAAPGWGHQSPGRNILEQWGSRQVRQGLYGPMPTSTWRPGGDHALTAWPAMPGRVYCGLYRC